MYNNQQPYYNGAVNRPVYQPQQFTQPFVGLRGRPVASVEEARASIIDFDGSVFYFPDLANKRIYTKQINLDGTASLSVYELKEIPIEQDVQFITREEFESVINQLRQSLVPPQPEIPAAKPVLNF